MHERERDYKGVRIEVRVCRIVCHSWLWCAVLCLVLPGLSCAVLCFPLTIDSETNVMMMMMMMVMYVCVHTYDHIIELQTLATSKA